MDYSQKLKQYRVSERFSQAEMANKIGVSQQVYSAAEAGKVKKIDPKIVIFVENLVSQIKNEEKATLHGQELPEILGDHEVRLVRLESFMEVAVPTMADLKGVNRKRGLVSSNEEVIDEIATLKGQMQGIAAKHFSRLQGKLFSLLAFSFLYAFLS